MTFSGRTGSWPRDAPVRVFTCDCAAKTAVSLYSLPSLSLLFSPRRSCSLSLLGTKHGCENKGMTGHGSITGLDPFLGKESLDSLARMGFGKRRSRLGPHRYHGIAARTRLSVAGKVIEIAVELDCRGRSILYNPHGRIASSGAPPTG